MEYHPTNIPSNLKTITFEEWSRPIVEDVRKEISQPIFKGRYGKLTIDDILHPSSAKRLEQRLRDEFPRIGNDPLHISVRRRDSVLDQSESRRNYHVISVRTQSYNEYQRKYGWIWTCAYIVLGISFFISFLVLMAQGISEGIEVLFG